jgi:hypothetical protein
MLPGIKGTFSGATDLKTWVAVDISCNIIFGIYFGGSLPAGVLGINCPHGQLKVGLIINPYNSLLASNTWE